MENNNTLRGINHLSNYVYQAFNIYFYETLIRIANGHPVDTGRLLNVLCTFNLRPVSTGYNHVATIGSTIRLANKKHRR